MKNIIALVVSMIIISACATNIVPQATGGSKADGIVNISYDVGQMQKPVIDWEQAEAEANRRCQAWGYKEAEAFGGGTRSCVQYGGLGGGCAVTQHTHSYQCLK